MAGFTSVELSSIDQSRKEKYLAGKYSFRAAALQIFRKYRPRKYDPRGLGEIRVVAKVLVSSPHWMNSGKSRITLNNLEVAKKIHLRLSTFYEWNFKRVPFS